MDKKISRIEIQRMQDIHRYLDVARIASWESGKILKNVSSCLKV